MITAITLIGILVVLVGLAAELQIEATTSSVEYLNPSTGRVYRTARVFGREIEVRS